MALQGTLDTVPLPDVLSLLASTSKVGRLHVEGPEQDGTLWVDGANIVSASCGERSGAVEVLVALLRLQEGAFRFDPGDPPPSPGLLHPIDDALAEATAWLSEWQAVENVLPSPDHQVRLRRDLDGPEVTISAEHWRGLIAVAEGGPVRQLVSRFGATEIEGARALVRVVEAGLVEVLAPPAGRAWSTWGSPSTGRARATPEEHDPIVEPEVTPAQDVVAEAPPPVLPEPAATDELGNGQPWRDQVRQLLGSAAADDEAPPPTGEHFGPATTAAAPPAPPPPPPVAPAPPAGSATEADRDVLLKFLSSVQP